VPPREIAIIIKGVLRSNRHLSRLKDNEILFRKVLHLLDFTKLTPKASEHMNRIMATYDKEINSK
jgi:hypothetical protein